MKSTADLVEVLLEEYDLNISNIFKHEDVSEKTKGEGGTVYDSFIPHKALKPKKLLNLSKEPYPKIRPIN